MQYEPVLREHDELRARVSEVVFHKEKLLFPSKSRVAGRFFGASGIDSDDAAGREIREGIDVAFSDLGVEKFLFSQCEQVGCPPGRCPGEELPERSDWRGCNARRAIGEPRNPGMQVVDVRVEKRRAFSGNKQTKPRNQVQIKSKRQEPVTQPVVCDVTDGQHLVKRGNRCRILNVEGQIVRYVKQGGPAEDLGGELRDAVQGQTSRGEALPHLMSAAIRRDVHLLAYSQDGDDRRNKSGDWPHFRPLKRFSPRGQEVRYS